jgi:hypothetical protein
MHTVNYPYSIEYLPAPGTDALSPALEVELISGNRRTRAVGIIDSGSTVTVFNPEHAVLLGIEDVSSGDLQTIRTQGGSVDCYVFALDMQVEIQGHTNRFSCRVGFFAGRRPRNILGTNVLFYQYQIGFNDRAQRVYFLPEGDA